MKIVAFTAVALLALNAPASAQVVSTWVQMMPGGSAEARIVTTSATCPELSVDGTAVKAVLRAAPDANFAVRLCAATIPAGAKSASVDGQSLPVAKADPQRILVIGDTGCRIKGSTVQACNDPKQWPFAVVAAAGAKLKPDLVIHVGDYLYRESQCPKDNTSCAGSPWGDNWPAWDADFFTPAAPLLAAAPFVVVRGNHEDCDRSGPGWLRLLGPLPFVESAPCDPHLSLYSIALGPMTLAIMDDASAPDIDVDTATLPAYQKDFAALQSVAPKPVWLVTHRPIWGAVKIFGIGVGGNRTLIAALDDSHPLAGVDFMLSGHIHAFEALNYFDNAPPQVIAGNSGDKLDAAPANVAKLNLGGEIVKDGMTLPGFGFLMMTKQAKGWHIDLYRVDGSIEGHCTLADRRVDCAKS
ncbi:MAG TPA: metallophosphoesterase [Rhizomicrobium sp.]|jgi:predicted phosphodiesterase